MLRRRGLEDSSLKGREKETRVKMRGKEKLSERLENYWSCTPTRPHWAWKTLDARECTYECGVNIKHRDAAKGRG